MADAWDPAAFGLTPVGGTSAPAAAPAPSWDPAQFGLTPVAATEAPQAQPAAAPADTYGRRLGLGVRDVVEGAAGAPYNALAWAFRQGGVPVHSLGENLTAMGLPEAQTGSEKLTSAIAQPIVSTLAGQGVGRAMMGAASPMAQGIGEALASQPGTQVAAAGLGGLTEDLTGSPTAGMVTGLGVGAVRGLASAAGPVLAVDPARAPLLATAARDGIPVTPRQMTGGKVASTMESVLAELPGSAGVQGRVNNTQQEAWNQAAMARTGTPADTALPQNIGAARANISQGYNDLTARNTMQADPQFLNEVRDTAANIHRYIPPSDRGPLDARVEDIVDSLQNGQMPGRTYQNLRSAIGEEIQNTADGRIRNQLTALQRSLDTAMDRSVTPEDQQAWQRLRRQHGALETVADAMNRPSEGTAVGNVPLAGLAAASNNGTTNAFANAYGQMNDLARLGQILKPTTPNSGTVQRGVITGLLTGSGLGSAGYALANGANPVMAAAPAAAALIGPYVAAQLWHSQTMRNALMNQAAPLTAQQNALLNLSITGQNAAGRLRDR